MKLKLDFFNFRVIKLIVLSGVGLLVFLAPFKFGITLNPVTMEVPKGLGQWLIFPWFHEIWQIAIVCLAAIWLLGAVADGKIRWRYSSVDIWILLFLGTAVLAAINAPNVLRARNCLWQWFAYVLCYWLVLQVLDDENDLKWLLSVLVIPAVMLSVYGVFQYYIGLPSTREWAAQYLDAGSMNFIAERLFSNRIFATFIYPNTFAGYILLLLPLSILILGIGFRRHQLWWRRVILALFGLELVHVLCLGYPQYFILFFLGVFLYPLVMFFVLSLTLSKGGYLVLLATLFFIGVFFCARIKGKRRILLIISTIAIVLIAVPIIISFGDGFVGRAKLSFLTRWEYWLAGVRMIKDYPWLGIGPDNFGVVYPLYKFTVAEEVQNAHNNFLQIWIEQGVFGFLGFCGIWITVLIKGWRGLFRPERSLRWLTLFAMVTGLLAFCLHNLGDFDWYIPGLTVLAWVFMAVVVNLSGRLREREIIVNKWRVRGILLLLIFVASGRVLISIENSLLGECYHKEAARAYKNKDYSLAEVMARVAVKLDQKRARTYYLLAKLEEKKQDYLGAVLWYKKALAYNRQNAVYWFQIAQAYCQHMQYTNNYALGPECEQGLLQAVACYPTSPFYHLHLGQYYESVGQFDRALAEYQLCRELNNKIKTEHELRGKLLKQMILPEEVMAELERRIARLSKIAEYGMEKSAISNPQSAVQD